MKEHIIKGVFGTSNLIKGVFDQINSKRPPIECHVSITIRNLN